MKAFGIELEADEAEKAEKAEKAIEAYLSL
jgi:hypothetical protein